MCLRAVGRRFTQMNAYFPVMNSKRCTLSSAYINRCNSSVRGSGRFHWNEKSNDTKFTSERVFIIKSQRLQRLRVTPKLYQWSSLLHARAFLGCEHGTQYWESSFHSTMHIRVTLTNLQCLSDLLFRHFNDKSQTHTTCWWQEIKKWGIHKC